MKRADWSSRLFEVIEQHRARTFVWSSNDCALFVARCVDAMTDSQIELSLLARYDMGGGAKRLAVSADMVDTVSEYLGPPAESRPQRGYVVLVNGGEGPALSISIGTEVVCLGATGLRRWKPEEIIAAWCPWAR